LGNGENYVTRSFVICSLFAVMYSSHDNMREIYGETRSSYIILVIYSIAVLPNLLEGCYVT
jgi:hypothetical protein